MSVNTNTATYTFVSSHTIKCYNIEFAENDKLVIPEGANVILEGTLTIEEETNEIDRITVNGTFNIGEEAAITIGAITNGKGIVVNSNNSVTLEGGSSITINNLISTGNGQAYGVLVGGVNDGDSGTFTQEKESVIRINNVTNNGDGNALAIGVYVVGVDSRFTQHGSITIGDVKNESGATGCLAVGVFVFGTFTQHGVMTINNVTNTNTGGGRAHGVIVSGEDSTFTQHGVMTITGVTNTNTGDGKAYGVYVRRTGNSFNAKNLTVSGVEESKDGSFGIVSTVEGGVVNSGSVRVYNIEIKYSSNGTSETNPLPINNTGGPDDNKFFTGQTYYNTK